MPQDSRRRNAIVIALVLIVILLLVLLTRCERPEPEFAVQALDPAPPASDASPQVPEAAGAAPSTVEPGEVLTPATLNFPAEVSAGSVFTVSWTGPENPRDYVTLARKDAVDTAYVVYRDTLSAATLEFTAPVEAGEWEMRYVAGRSKQVLGRAPLTVVPVAATLDAAPEIVLGARISVAWAGPDNEGDYITIVPKDTPDGRYGNYTVTSAGSPLTVLVPAVPGEAELRYMTGQGNKVLGRRAVRILPPEIILSAPASAAAGSTLDVTWTGPNNQGDYITLVARDMPDGRYGNYTLTSGGSPLSLLMPMMTGEAELRYMTGQGNKVLARRAIELLPVEAVVSAPAEARVGVAIPVAWIGPNYKGDYLTIVPKETPHGRYGPYANASAGSPVNLKAPDTPGDFEIRYMTYQGNNVIGRCSIRLVE